MITVKAGNQLQIDMADQRDNVTVGLPNGATVSVDGTGAVSLISSHGGHVGAIESSWSAVTNPPVAGGVT